MFQTNFLAVLNNPTVYRDLDSVLKGFNNTQSEVLKLCQGLYKPIAVIFLAIAGLAYLTDLGNPRKWEALKGTFIGLVVAGIVVYCAEPIIDTIKAIMIGQ